MESLQSHQTNAVNLLPNGHWSGTGQYVHCNEDDERNAALLWVNATTGEHGILATGVRNSFDGVWVDDIGYLFSDNGQDAEGDDFPDEINLLVVVVWLARRIPGPISDGTSTISNLDTSSSVNGMTTRRIYRDNIQFTQQFRLLGNTTSKGPSNFEDRFHTYR